MQTLLYNYFKLMGKMAQKFVISNEHAKNFTNKFDIQLFLNKELDKNQNSNSFKTKNQTKIIMPKSF